MDLLSLKDTPTAQLSKAEQLVKAGAWREFLAGLSVKEQMVLATHWPFWGRPEQFLPTHDDWGVLLFLAGRGAGKTRPLAEIGHQWARNRKWNLLLVGETVGETIDVLIKGESGLLATQKPDNPCVFKQIHRGEVHWPKTGTTARVFSGDNPDQLRGPNAHGALVDELGKFRYPTETWEQIEFCTRVGRHPRIAVATTPRPIKLLREMLTTMSGVITRTWSTFRNAANLALSRLRSFVERYVGTRVGRQELFAELLSDAEGALWKRDWIDTTRVVNPPTLSYICVGVDPPGGDVTECGIVASGRNFDGTDSYTIADDSIAGTPDVWAKQVWATAIRVNADIIMAERNHGGLMVQHTLDTCRPDGCYIPIELVTASQGKEVRGQPVAMLMEQGRDHHVGTFAMLEDEMCSWEPNQRLPSPNHIDAKVWSVMGLGLVGDSTEAFAL